jgi:putative Holliday junction resolvase
VKGAILAVDVGTVRIGIAACESLELPALPVTTLAHASREKDVAAIAALARERNAHTIVVGYPLRLDGQRGPAAEKMDRFIAALRAGFDGEVVAVDERLTTAAADAKLRGTQMSGARRRELVDRFAAVEILESYRAALRRSGSE